MECRNILQDNQKYIIDDYFFRVYNLFSCTDTKIENNIYHNAATLILISENYEWIENKEDWHGIIKEIMLLVKYSVEEGYFSRNLGLFNGLAEIDIAIYLIHKKTGLYKKFSEEIHNYLLERTKKYIAYCMSKLEDVMLFHYDLIAGLSGIGNSLLMRENLSVEDRDVLNQILYYLTVLSWKITLPDGDSVIRFYIKSSNQIRDDEKKSFPNGNLNFGLAHGMMGPLMLLAKAYNKGYCVYLQEEAIERLAQIYYKYRAMDENNVLIWPTQLRKEDFNKKFTQDNYRTKRASWCYGTAGLSRGLYLVGKWMDDSSLKNDGLRSLLGIASMNFDDLALMSPIVCHGYAGLLAILLVTGRNEPKYNDLINGTVELLCEKIVDAYKPSSKFGFIGIDHGILPNGGKKIIKQDNLDGLEGATGIVSVLLANLKGHNIKLFEQLMIT